MKKYPASVGTERLTQIMSLEINQFLAVFFNRIERKAVSQNPYSSPAADDPKRTTPNSRDRSRFAAM